MNYKVAVKAMKKKEILGRNLDKLKQEIQILSTLDHPNICKYYETYESLKHVYIIMEHCGGTELFQKITSVQGQSTCFSERQAKNVMKQIFLAINHCHCKGIVHRDLKLENIIIREIPDSEKDDLYDVKIIDFGLSKILTGPRKLQSKVGTPYYIAPEII